VGREGRVIALIQKHPLVTIKNKMSCRRKRSGRKTTGKTCQAVELSEAGQATKTRTLKNKHLKKMNLEAKPLFSLTIGEFMTLTKELVNEALKSKSQEKEKEPEGKEETFSIKELAKFLKCSLVSIHNYKKLGLPYYKIGRKVLFNKSEVLNFMKKLKNKLVIKD
jgi:excisionase family DNA binding protein